MAEETIKPRVPLVARIYWAITHKQLSEDQRHAFWSWFLTILLTAFISSTFPIMLYVQAQDRLETKINETKDKKSDQEFIDMRVFMHGSPPLEYVVGTRDEFPRATSEMVKDIKELTVKINNLRQATDILLEQSNKHERALKKFEKER